MDREKRTYIAIDLKSFYASVECVERGLNPLTANLVVADPSRTEKTICLAVSPSLKAYGIAGRARLFELVQKVKEVNAMRLQRAKGHKFTGESFDDIELKHDPSLAVSYITAPPRMARYMEYSRKIFSIYLRYIAPEDIHVYSVDEVFIDATAYLEPMKVTAHELTLLMIREVMAETGITATAGIGTNLYLCKVAMDIVAKKMPPDKDGVRIAELDEMSYRRELWNHRPITDFWRVGKGISKKLAKCGIYTMGDVARCSLGDDRDFYSEKLLYKMFGINAELLIDHAWGYEPCLISDIQAYRPQSSSMSSGQVLQEPYKADKARIVAIEMADGLSMDLVRKGLVADKLVLTICYDVKNLEDPDRRSRYKGPVVKDQYGRNVPKHSHGTECFEVPTSSTESITRAARQLFDKIVQPELLVRRIYVVVDRIRRRDSISQQEASVQLNLFAALQSQQASDSRTFADSQQNTSSNQSASPADSAYHHQDIDPEKELNMQEALLKIRERYGKNAIFKGLDMEEGATALSRNAQIGGHKA